MTKIDVVEKKVDEQGLLLQKVYDEVSGSALNGKPSHAQILMAHTQYITEHEGYINSHEKRLNTHDDKIDDNTSRINGHDDTLLLHGKEIKKLKKWQWFVGGSMFGGGTVAGATAGPTMKVVLGKIVAIMWKVKMIIWT